MTRKVVNSPDEIIADMRRLQAERQARILNAMLRFVDNPIMSESAVECPVRTGQLRRSGTNQEEGGPPDVMIMGDKITVTFGYGTTYGLYVHEKLDAFHKPPTKAKFLEDPLNRHADEFTEQVANEVDAMLGVG